ncbi:TetR family transcriptional regulator [Shimia isoporae]|uniref:TetR family transcriptional regulator n=1 Tax=Shimia isoporae TaxID=647720 RepID=A0A4R1N0E8_9RHOB|nr:TetR/AcrR family transcriptional regulator [Shimia isoporae]TCK99265.1 TetR family transcriptional regulator [Shimia isoporae]
MAEKTGTYHHGNLSAALVAAGTAFLREQGAEKLSLRAVAERVGVSRTAPYAHFPDKRSLLLAISAGGFRQLAEAMESRRTPDQSPREQVLLFGAAYVQFALDNANLYRLMLSTMTPGADEAAEVFHSELKREATKPYAILKAEFERMVSDPSRAEALSQGAWGMVHGLASLVGEELIVPPEDGVEGILRTFMNAQQRV